MKYVDEFRDSQAARRLIRSIQETATRRWTLMEVCGGQTHGLLRYGIESQVREQIELIHGPGCPVCVTPLESIDFAIQLASEPQVLMTSFGDMLRVPGSDATLLDAKSAGGNVQAVYSPLDAVQLARRRTDVEVVFFAVGFETTAPATALAVKQASELKLNNFSLLTSHVRVQPAMEALMRAPGNRIEGFLAAGHVCTVAGLDSYEEFVARFQVPVVAAGFEPIDLLSGLLAAIRQLEAGKPRVENCYERSVRDLGNPVAQTIVDDVFRVCDRPWRGMGNVADGGLELQPAYRNFDAQRRFRFESLPVLQPTHCPSGDVMTGRLKPPECPSFGIECTPDSPLGAPMVSTEGACAAYYRYQQTSPGRA